MVTLVEPHRHSTPILRCVRCVRGGTRNVWERLFALARSHITRMRTEVPPQRRRRRRRHVGIQAPHPYIYNIHTRPSSAAAAVQAAMARQRRQQQQNAHARSLNSGSLPFVVVVGRAQFTYYTIYTYYIGQHTNTHTTRTQRSAQRAPTYICCRRRRHAHTSSPVLLVLARRRRRSVLGSHCGGLGSLGGFCASVCGSERSVHNIYIYICI